MGSESKRPWDVLVLGAVAGIIGVIVKDVLELVGLFFIPAFKTCPRLAAGIIIDPQISEASTLPIVGLEIDIAVSIVVGVIVVTVLAKFGWKYWFAKGLVVGLLAWTIIDIILSKLLSRVPPPNSVAQIELSLLIHFVYGITVVGTAMVLGKRYLD